MAKKKRDRRLFTDEFKQQLIAEIDGGKKLIDVAKEHGLQPSQLSLWKKKYGGGRSAKKAAKATRTAAPKAAARRSAPSTASASAAAPAASRASNNAPASGIAELERMIGQLAIENARLRRELDELRSK